MGTAPRREEVDQVGHVDGAAAAVVPCRRETDDIRADAVTQRTRNKQRTNLPSPSHRNSLFSLSSIDPLLRTRPEVSDHDVHVAGGDLAVTVEVLLHIALGAQRMHDLEQVMDIDRSIPVHVPRAG